VRQTSDEIHENMIMWSCVNRKKRICESAHYDRLVKWVGCLYTFGVTVVFIAFCEASIGYLSIF
jgi:hypothetical protein